jgi:CRP/FNR family cyclic AMP-dependent transcriptional regulator
MHGITSNENWIGELPPVVRSAILDRMVTVDVPAGGAVKLAGEPPLRMHQMESGYVKLIALHQDGRQSIITIYSPGNCFSETAIIARRPYHHTTLAMTDCRIRQLGAADFWELYHRHPEIPETLCRKFAGSISRQMASRDMRVVHRLGKRVALLFESLAERCAETRTSNSATIAVPITQTDIGDHFDVTRQSIQREITALKSAGILDKHAGRWIVRDIERLSRV